ncbi:dystrophin-1-like isoform X3 [Frieseomelitta varia]|uniref:dystrophin-1-like isoform X3 n=1 Tax=Frieseomelitta varia TaxID=561572 RepID=UPI001CB69FDC|nr:dystrophin-1-like isoform X3 [Frieseomelitta varia]
MQSIIQSIEQCNVIRYTSYRTAAKMQILHKELNMQYVQLQLIAGVFERHRLSITENCVNLDSSEIEDVLSDIYFAACKENSTNFDVDFVTKLALNYILTTYDKQCAKTVSVFSVKVALVLISSGRLQEKYGYLYQQLADHNACLSKASLHSLLTNICKITEMLGESAAYGSQNIQSHIDKCFSKSQGCLGVTESEFAAWIMQEPPLLVWVTTFNRIKSAEYIIHNVRCSSCKIIPIQGPRYTCLKCASYHQCQHCFLYDKISGKHKLKHPIREFCTKTSNRELTKLVIELIRNKLRLCPARSIELNVDENIPHISNEITHTDCESVRSTMKRRVLSDPQKELQSIITHLEEENKQLQIELLDIQGTKAERLQRHRVTIESQLQRLKLLKRCLFTDRIRMPQVINHMQSTPMVPALSSRLTCLPINFELSPIIRQENVEHISDVNVTDILQSNNFTRTGDCINKQNHDIMDSAEASTSLGFSNVLEPTQIELSTWIGGTKRLEMKPADSGFSQWLGSNNSDSIHRDNTPSSLQRPDKHSQHSSLQNIQGDLNDILDRLQNMVTDDRLLDESYVANDNCKLKRATTEMEDLLTGLIQGMESRKSKLTTIV